MIIFSIIKNKKHIYFIYDTFHVGHGHTYSNRGDGPRTDYYKVNLKYKKNYFQRSQKEPFVNNKISEDVI